MANTKVTGDLIASSTIATGNIADNAVTSDKISGITTAHITEGSNLYYTDARADARVALVVDSAPSTLNTLNELADALGDDPNFATTTATSIGLKAPLASPSFTGNAAFGGGLSVAGSTSLAGLSASSVTTAAVQLQGDLNVLNKAQTAYITLADRDTSGSEVVYNLANVGSATFAGNISGVNATFNGGASANATPLTIGSSSQTSYTLQQFQTSSHGTNNAYLIAYGAGHGSQAGNFAMKNALSGKNIFFEVDNSRELIIENGSSTFVGELKALGGDIHFKEPNSHTVYIDFPRTATHTNPTARIMKNEPAATHTSSLGFYTSNASGSAPNLVRALYLDENQNATFAGDVGIGVTPTKDLQVSGEALFGNGTDGLLLSYSGGNSSGIIDTGHSSTALEFRVGNTQELLINGSSATFAGKIICNNVGNDRKIQFNRTGGNVYSIEHDSAFLYFYNVTTNSIPLKLANNNNATFAGSVGIGETSPDLQLHIKNTGTGSTGIAIENTNNAQNLDIDFYNNVGSVNGRIRYEEGAGAFNISPNVGSPNAMYINYSNNVGIGTTSPGRKLTVTGNTSGDANNLLLSNEHDANGDSASIGFSMLSNNTYVKAGIFFQRITTQGRGDLIFANNNEVNGNNVGITNEIMSIKNTGAIEIKGTSTTLNGKAFITNTNALMTVGSTQSSGVPKDMAFFNGAERVRIQATTGNVGINDTNPAEKLEVGGNIKAADTTGKFFSNTYSFSGVVLADFFQHTNDGIWEYTIKLNPNTAGSGAYTDYYYGKIGVGIGWSGSNVTQYLWHQPTNTAPRTLYNSGGGNLGLSFQMLYSGSVYTTLPLNTGPWYLRLTGLGTNIQGEIFFRRLA